MKIQVLHISSCFKVAFSVVDVTLIRAFVDLGFDGMSPQKRLPVRVRETNILFCDKWLVVRIA